MSETKINEKEINNDDIEDVVNTLTMKKKLRKGYSFIQFSGYLYVFLASIALILAVFSGQFLWIIFYFITIILCIQYLIKLPKKLKMIIGNKKIDVKDFNEENKYFINAMYISALLIAARIVYMVSESSDSLSLGYFIWFFVFYLYFAQRTLSLPKKILEKQPKL